MGRKRSDLTKAIDEAIDLAHRNEGMDYTPRVVRQNLRMSPEALDTARDRGLDDAIVRRMKQRGDIITDSVPKDGGRPRGSYYYTGTEEHKEQLRIQAENGRYTQNRIAAESAVIAFMEDRTQDLGYEPPWLTIAEDVDRIYAMHGVSAPGKAAA